MFGKRKFKVIPNVIDSENNANKFNSSCRLQTREKFRTGNKFVVITVGRISKQKNPFLLLIFLIMYPKDFRKVNTGG